VIPRLEGLPRGLWRLLWLGKLRTSNHNPTGYEVEVHFSWGGGGQKPPLQKWLPLTHLPFLRLQSLWENDLFRSLPDYSERSFSVLTAGASLRPPWSPGNPDSNLFSTNDYFFHRIRDLAKCWEFGTLSGELLIVPAWEILRAWYLFDPSVMPAVLAGAVYHPDAIPERLRPWRDGTGTLEDGRLQFVRAQWISDSEAKRLARLLFVDVARERTYGIYRHLMTDATRKRPAEESERVVELPAPLPPYDGVAALKVHCIPLSPSAKGTKRWLVLNLKGGKLPDPFDNLIIVRENDNRQGMNKDDPNLRKYPRRRSKMTSKGFGVDEALMLTMAGPDPSIEDTQITGFDFDDEIVRSVKTVLLDKPMQGWRAVKAPEERTSVEGGSTDTAAPSRPGNTRVRTEDVRPSMSSDALFRLSLAAFRSITRKRVQSETSWRAELVSKNEDGTFPVRAKYQGYVRQFAILAFEKNNEIAYALDAERLRPGESFSLILCRSSGAYPLACSLFEEWLGMFPAQRLPWRGDGILPRDLVLDDFLHQPQRDGLSMHQIQEQLERRLLYRLQKILFW